MEQRSIRVPRASYNHHQRISGARVESSKTLNGKQHLLLIIIESSYHSQMALHTAALVAALIFAAAAPTIYAQQQKHNLLVILTDQQRYDTIRMVQEERGVPERARIRTPNLDRIAREGAYFRNAYTHSAVCGPARSSLLTGSTIENTGIKTNKLSRDENLAGTDAEYKIAALRTYDEILVEDHSYVAEYYGKWHTPESKGYVYSNDVRRGSGVEAWFGKYNDDGTKHYSWGMSEWYLMWLKDQPAALAAKVPFESGDQVNTYSKYYYRPDPLDKRYGVETGAPFGKVGQPEQQGLNRLEDGLSNTAQQAAEMLEALERLGKGSKPFSLHLSLHSPHPPIIVTKRYYDMYSPTNMAIPASIKDDMNNSAYHHLKKKGCDDPAKVQRWTANYYGLITEVDEWVGRILNKLDDLGITNTTLLAFSSDHGEMLGGHGLRDKSKFYEEATHIPLLLRMPGTIPKGTIVDDPVSHLDLHRTFLDYSVGRTDYKSDGTSLRRHIDGVHSEDSFIVAMRNYTDARRNFRPSSGPAFMIRKGSWKLILPGQADSGTLDMLYNLEDDPAEMNNLVGKNGIAASDEIIGKAENLKGILVKYLEESNHPAADEIQRRRTWRITSLWSDFALDFRNTLPDGTRTEYLCIGSPNRKPVSVTLEGEHASRYRLKLVSQHGLRDRGFSVVAVRYSGSNFADAMPANLVIKLDGGEEKKVALNPPRTIFYVASKGDTESKSGFSDSLKFSLDLTVAPTRNPTSEPTASPTITMASTHQTAPPTVFPTCSGKSVLGPKSRLYAEEKPSFICSPNGKYRFGLATDGELSLWHGPTLIWSAGTCCTGSGTYVSMQSKGNLVVYSDVQEDLEAKTIKKALWASDTKKDNALLMHD